MSHARDADVWCSGIIRCLLRRRYRRLNGLAERCGEKLETTLQPISFAHGPIRSSCSSALFWLLRSFELFDHVQSPTRLDHGQPCVNVVVVCRQQLRFHELSWQAVKDFIKHDVVFLIPTRSGSRAWQGYCPKRQTFNKMRSGMWRT